MKSHYETFAVKDRDILLDFIAVMAVQDTHIDSLRYMPSEGDALSLQVLANGRGRILTLSSGGNKLSACFSVACDSVVYCENDREQKCQSPEFIEGLQRVADSIACVCEA